MLAVCSRNLLGCARGHAARLSVPAASSRHLQGWTRSPGDRSPKTQPTPATAETKLRFCRAGHRPMCLHLLSDHTSAFPSLEQASSECVNRGKHSVLNRPKRRNCTYNSQAPSLTLLLRERAVSLSGYCTTPGNQVEKSADRGPGDKEAPSSPTFTPATEGKFKELYENPWTIPNFLCMSRIVLSPFLGYLIMEQYFHLSLGLFVLAGATDLLDGYIARNWPNQKSALGSALDPLADKILISVLYVSLTCAQLIPVPLTVLVICRDIALIAAVFYVRYKTVPPPVTLNKFFNPCYTTAQLKPTLISKFNTAIQLLLVAASLASPIFHYTDSVLLQSLWYVTALTTAASGYSYYHYGRKTVEVLNNTK